MKRLKERWGIYSNFQLVMILIVFAVTGSSAARLATPVTSFLGITAEHFSAWVYWPARIILIFPIYQVLLIIFGFIFGQFNFFGTLKKRC